MTINRSFNSFGQSDALSAGVAKFFKTVYKDDDLADHSLTRCPAYDSLAVERFVGDNYTYPIVLADASGIGQTRAQAKLNARQGLAEKWTVSQVYQQFKHLSWDWQTQERAKDKIGSYVDTVKRDLAKGIDELKSKMGAQFWNDSAGDLGQVKGLVAPVPCNADFTVSLVNRDSAFKFTLNAIYDFFSTRTIGGQKRGQSPTTHSFKLIAINHNDGGLTFQPVTTVDDAAYLGLAAAGVARINDGVALNAPGDYVFAAGTRNTFAYGIRTFIPDTDADVIASPTLFGVNRTQHMSGLAGTRSSWQGTFMDSIRELCLRMQYTTAQSVSHVLWMNPRDFISFQQEAEQNGAPLPMDAGMSMKLGVKALVVNVPGGEVRVAADKWLDAGRMYLLEMDALRILAVGGRLISEINDGLSMPRLAAADGDGNYMELRSYTQTIVTRPINCGVCLIPTAV